MRQEQRLKLATQRGQRISTSRTTREAQTPRSLRKTSTWTGAVAPGCRPAERSSHTREVLKKEVLTLPAAGTLEHASREAAGVLACAVTQARHQSEMLGLPPPSSSRGQVLQFPLAVMCCVRTCCREDLRCVRTFLGGDLFRLPRPPDDAAKINSEQAGHHQRSQRLRGRLVRRSGEKPAGSVLRLR